MNSLYKHGDRVSWCFVKTFKGKRKMFEKFGSFVRKVEGSNPFGQVFVKFDDNRTMTRVHQYELTIMRY